MEACSGAHPWARQFRQYGHPVKRMAPKFVTPYRMSGKRGKNDATDAAATGEAVSRPARRFVPVAEFGRVLSQKVACLRRAIGACLEDLPGYANPCVGDLLALADLLDQRIEKYDRLIGQAVRDEVRSKRLMKRQGTGPITANALLASIGNGHDFQNDRQVVAWIGLAPGQFSSGGKAQLGRITQAGDACLRGHLIMGARAVLSGPGEKPDCFGRWVRSLVRRRGYWRAVVAIAARSGELPEASGRPPERGGPSAAGHGVPVPSRGAWRLPGRAGVAVRGDRSARHSSGCGPMSEEK